jgi:hypothetical protein
MTFAGMGVSLGIMLRIHDHLLTLFGRHGEKLKEGHKLVLHSLLISTIMPMTNQ